MVWPETAVITKIETLNDKEIDDWMEQIYKLGLKLDYRQNQTQE